MTLVSSCRVWIPWTFDHTTLCPKTLSPFASSKVTCELHQHLTLKPGGWNSTHNQLGPRDVQPCPEFMSFFSNQINKPKSLKNIRVIVILSRPSNPQGLFGASKWEHIPCIQASLRPRPHSASDSLRKHKAHIQKAEKRMLLAVNAGSCYPVSQGSVLCEWGVGTPRIWVGSKSVTTYMTAS